MYGFYFCIQVNEKKTCPGGSVVKKKKKKSICKARDVVSISGSERSHGEGNSNTLQDSCLGNPMDRGSWKATVHGVIKSQT